MSLFTRFLFLRGTPEAKEHVRSLIEKVVLTPKKEQEELSIDLYGNLTGILNIASEEHSKNKMSALTKTLGTKVVNGNISSERSLQLVAGSGFEPLTFGL